MQEHKVKDISIKEVKSRHDCLALGDDLLLYERFFFVPKLTSPRRLKFNSFAMCTRGKVECSINGSPRSFQAGEAIILGVDNVVDSYTLSYDCEGVCLIASNEFRKDIILGVHEFALVYVFLRRNPIFHLSQRDMVTVHDYYRLLIRRLSDPDHIYRRSTVRMLVTTMGCDLCNALLHEQGFNSQRNVKRDKVFMQFVDLINQNFRVQRSVSWYADQMGITAKHLSETVKRVSGMTPSEWIETFVLREVCISLRYTSKPLKKIAEELNFPNQSLLTKYFRKKFDMSPSDYRKIKV